MIILATPYSDVVNDFLSKVTDYDLPDMLLEDREEIVLGYMKRSCAKFSRLCLIDLLDIDEESEQFNQTLDEEVIDIITEGMIVEWLKPKLYTLENLRNVLNTKDFNMYSPANLLSQIRETYNESKSEFKSLMKNYSHYYGNVGDSN